MLQNDSFQHYGTPRHSGRYPWGSGNNPQNSKDFLSYVKKLSDEGLSQKEIANALGISTTELRTKKSIAKSEARQQDSNFATSLKDKGYSNVAIGERMGINESSVRNLLNPAMKARSDAASNTAEFIKSKIGKKGIIDVGEGVENQLGISDTQLKVAVGILKEQGYSVSYVKVKQLGTDKYTTIKVVHPSDMTYSEVYKNRDKIKPPQGYSEDGGRTMLGIEPPTSVSSKRLAVRYGPEGGSEMDGVIELRPGKSDISLGNSRYAQVRIAVDGTHYLKGMAIYSDDLPSGVDIRFNTSKNKKTSKKEALKELKDDPDNPFGAVVRQRHYTDSTGKRKLSPVNIVNEEGDWDQWSKNLASQMLSKQSSFLAKQQLGLAYSAKASEFDEISRLTNPAVKRKLLQSFSDDCDSSSVHLKAAALPRQRTQVILPIRNLKDTEIYAPNFRDGENVVLIRYPHGGKFEIPELTVNNRNRSAIKTIGRAKDAVGISHKVAERLSGADFDGDTVLVIPNRNGRVKTSSALKGLKNFDPKTSYPAPPGMPRVKSKTKNTEMGNISNLITDMTIKGATQDELARAVRHSMVVIDSEKHHLNYKQSAIDNGIPALKKKYQGSSRSGASTLISRSKSQIHIDKIELRKAKDGGPINKRTGELVYVKTGDKPYLNKNTGKLVKPTTKTTRMQNTKDAFSLSSGTQIEAVYAAHANKLKALANTARKEMISTKSIPYSPSAKKTYNNQVVSLRSKLDVALRNKPLERKAQLVANTTVDAKLRANPDMEKEDIKRLKGQALTEARNRVGAKKIQVDITPDEWKAVQAGAISNNMLTKILDNTDLDKIKSYATPRDSVSMSPSRMARAKTLLNAGYTQAEVADALGVSISTISRSL